MYKFTNQIASAKLVLVRKQLNDGSCAALIVMRTPRRRYAQEPCPEPCPPTPKAAPKSRKLLWGALGATMLTGAAVVYAKSNPDTRNWLESNAPWANEFVALVYQEDTTYWRFSVNQFNKLTKVLGEFMFGKEGRTPLEIKTRQEQDLEQDAKESFEKPEYQLPPTKFEPLYVKEIKIETPEVATEATLIQTEKCDPTPAPAVKVTHDIVQLEHEMHENTKAAIDNYKKATKACIDYNKALFKIVETPVEELDKKLFTSLQAAQKDRNSNGQLAKEASAKAKLAIDTLDRMIQAGVPAPMESVVATQRYIKQFRRDLAVVEDAFDKEYEKAVISDKYWSKVEAARNAYAAELQALFPGADLRARTLQLRGDADLLLVYTLKQVQFLQKELAELQSTRELKISRAIECHDEKALIEAKVEDMIKKERIEKEREYMKKCLEIQAEANRRMRQEIKKQYELQQEIQQEKLKNLENQIMATFSRAVSEKVEAERAGFKRELAAMAGKMKAIEQTLKERAKAESEARRSQSLWAAAEALLAATRRDCALTAVDDELRALERAGKDDTLVQTVLKGIPDEVRSQGIATEKTLREKFDALEKTAVKVALVGKDGAALPVYFMSWLQSKLLFSKLAEIPQDELDNQPTDFSKLDTFDIIQRARHRMQHGDLAGALRYVLLLRDAPRAAAQPWAAAARRHLEVRQAAEAVMAHASVAGLLYL